MQLSEIKLRHREILVDLISQTLLYRPPDLFEKKSDLSILLKDNSLKEIIEIIIKSDEFVGENDKLNIGDIANISPEMAFPFTERISNLTPRARSIYAYFKKNLN
jgi:hypothetical protein